jgi:cellobiose-specific phosphotransferase system component IIA
MTVELNAVSTKTLVSEKKLDEAYKPKLTEIQKRNPNRDPDFNPVKMVFAPDHFITMVIRKPIAREVTTIPQTINSSGFR